jgi:uncharacterized protein YqjF (DUF2071 family)
MTPTLDQRLALRERPTGPVVMRQRWSDLLFLHWKVDPDMLRPRLPAGLHLDLHQGEAWLGIVPFFMQRVRPTLLPPVPGLSWFLELNVRTYVHNDQGIPGVWFFSLDCDQALAVEIARRFFHLPYEHAKMSAQRRPPAHANSGAPTAKPTAPRPWIHYTCRRETQGTTATYRYQAGSAGQAAEPGTLEFFLAERYLLYSADPRGHIFCGRVHHAPYQLSSAQCPEWSTAPATWSGLHLPETPPDSTLVSAPVDVRIHPLRCMKPAQSP